MFKLQVLVTTMHQSDTSKYENMNLQSDAVIANQADAFFLLEEDKNGHIIKMVTTKTRGVSINRNIALMHSSSDAEYVMFADDDQEFVEGYEKIIEDELQKCPDADALKFYCQSKNRPLSFVRPRKLKRVNRSRVMSTGAPCMVFRRSFLIENSLYFQSNLGPGAEIFCGEDSVFFCDFFKAKGKMYVSPILLSYVDQGNSSWYEGITERYLEAIGYIYSRIYRRIAMLAIYRRVFKLKGKTNKFTFAQMVSIMRKGMKKQRGKE